MKLKKIIIFTILVILIGALIAYKMYNKPHVDVAVKNAEITLTANALLNDFTADETVANTKYLEKIVQVTGTVAEVKLDNGKGIITIETSDDFASVLCHLSEVSSKNTTTIKVGQTITIKGICTGFLMDVVLIKCEFIN